MAEVQFDKTVVIASGTTTHATGADLTGRCLVGLIFPAALTQTAVSFTSSDKLGGAYVALADGAGSNVSKTVAVSKQVKLDPADFVGVRYLKLIMGGNEAADRTVILVTKDLV